MLFLGLTGIGIYNIFLRQFSRVTVRLEMTILISGGHSLLFFRILHKVLLLIPSLFAVFSLFPFSCSKTCPIIRTFISSKVPVSKKAELLSANEDDSCFSIFLTSAREIEEGLAMFGMTKIMLPAAIVQIIFWGTIGYKLLDKVLKPNSPDFDKGNMYAASEIHNLEQSSTASGIKGRIALGAMILCIILFVLSGFSDFVKICGPLLLILIVVVTISSIAFLFYGKGSSKKIGDF